MREGVSLQKVTELIVDRWFGNGPNWEERRPYHEDQQTQHNPAESLVASKRRKLTHKSLPKVAPVGWHGFRESAENSNQYSAIDQLTEMHVMKTPYVSSTVLKHELH